MSKEIIERLNLLSDIKVMGYKREVAEILVFPPITDENVIDEIMKDVNIEDIETRRVYLFVLVYLFSPLKFAGYKISKKIMKKITFYIKSSPSSISHYTTDLDFQYKTYTDFRNKVNDVLNHIKENVLSKE